MKLVGRLITLGEEQESGLAAGSSSVSSGVLEVSMPTSVVLSGLRKRSVRRRVRVYRIIVKENWLFL